MATGYVEDPEAPWQTYVRALDVTTGKLKWEYKQVGSKRYGAGVLSTAGGLVFAGDDQGVLTALDAKSGKASVALQHGPADYRVSDDVQLQRETVRSFDGGFKRPRVCLT